MCLPYKHEGLPSKSWCPHAKTRHGGMLIILVLERQRQDELRVLWLVTLAYLGSSRPVRVSMSQNNMDSDWGRILFCSLASICMHIHVHLHKMSTHITQEVCMYLGTHTCHMHCICYVLQFFIVVRVMCSCMVMVLLKMLIHFWNRTNGLINIRQHDPRGWSLSSHS